MIRLSLFATIAIMLSCNQEPEKTPDPRNEIEESWNAFEQAWESADAATCASMYTQGGLNIPNNFEVNNGREDIQEFYQFLFDSNLSSDYKTTILDFNHAGDNATDYGEFTVDWVRKDSSTWTYEARYLAQWTKTESGWKISKFLFNTPPVIQSSEG